MKTTSTKQLQPKLGARVRQKRMAAGISQTALAADAGITNVWLCFIEAGTATPSLGVILALANRLGVSVGSLVD